MSTVLRLKNFDLKSYCYLFINVYLNDLFSILLAPGYEDKYQKSAIWWYPILKSCILNYQRLLNIQHFQFIAIETMVYKINSYRAKLMFIK